MSLIMNESNFQHILRVLNTNLDGKVKVMFALTSIKGVGRRFSNIACKKLRWKKVSRAVLALACGPGQSNLSITCDGSGLRRSRPTLSCSSWAIRPIKTVE